MDYLKLQNGSDIRGVAIAAPGEEVNLSPDVAWQITTSYAEWLSRRLKKDAQSLRICVGYDSRLSGEVLKRAVLASAESAGATGYDAGLATTPAMFMSTVMPGFDMDGAIMITASHLPYNRNGFKHCLCFRYGSRRLKFLSERPLF